MNAVIDHVSVADLGVLPDRRRLARMAACVTISLAVHALLLSIHRRPHAPLPVTVAEPLTVRLQPTPATPAAAEPALPALQPRAAARPAPRARAPRRVIAVPPRAPAAEEKPFTVAPPPAEEAPAPTPRFDLDAARSVARKVANEPDPAKAGTALERLPPPPLQTETKLERAIKAAKRPDCKDGVPGGLLAPLYLMMDKKDSGCKW